MTKEEFYLACEKNNLFLSEIQKKQLYTYFELLVETNKVMNLTGIVEENEVYEKHFYDSLLFSFCLPLEDKSLVDVGTGAGFPGLVLAICYPLLKVSLVEPLTKRCNFLNKVIDELGLTNVEVINSRSEDLSSLREKFDLVKRSNLVILEVLKTKKEYLKEYIALETQDISNFDLERDLKTAESIINNLFHDHEDLESNENMINIIHDFKECNEKLTACILYYNKEVAILNNITRKFPNNIVAKIHHIKIKPFFDGKDMQDDNNNDFKF